MKLVNVRLSDEDAAKVADLRRHGVELSEVVREAVRARHLALRPPLRPGDVRPMLEAIYARHPLEEEQERPVVDSSDRRAMHRLIRKKLSVRRSG
ncbi:MAG: hypothetical protein JOZ69_04415 [Myxococcales bacterium]|nr:hypothetical protein [Myxococcales bacterium]